MAERLRPGTVTQREALIPSMDGKTEIRIPIGVVVGPFKGPIEGSRIVYTSVAKYEGRDNTGEGSAEFVPAVDGSQAGKLARSIFDGVVDRVNGRLLETQGTEGPKYTGEKLLDQSAR